MKIKVIEERHGKTWQKRCDNCDSLLEYEDSDIYTVERDCGEKINEREVQGFIFPKIIKETVPTVQRVKYVRCPVCGREAVVKYIDWAPVKKGTYEAVGVFKWI